MQIKGYTFGVTGYQTNMCIYGAPMKLKKYIVLIKKIKVYSIHIIFNEFNVSKEKMYCP